MPMPWNLISELRKHPYMRLSTLPLFLAILLFACQEPAAQDETSTNEDAIADALSELDGDASIQKVAALSMEEMESAQSQYLVPSPGEVLSSLDKLDRVAWSQLASYNAKADYDDKYARALNLGVRVADAFMAVNAEDAAKFGEMSTIIFDLAREIGLGDVLENQRSELDNLAAEGQWEELKAALDNVQTDVRDEVEAMGEDDLVALASAGGWLEGMSAVTAHLQENYSADKAELLQQSELLAYFIQKFAEMGSTATSHPLVEKTQLTLLSLQPLVEGESAPSVEVTQQIHQLTEELVAEIESGK